MRTNRRDQLVRSGLWYLGFTLLICVSELSMAQQPVPTPGSQTEPGGAGGDFAAYAWVFAASVLILASALAVLIVAVARELLRAPASALASRQWHISLVAGNAALFGILIGELLFFFSLQAPGVTRPAASPSRNGSADTVPSAVPMPVGETAQETASGTPPVAAEAIGPGDSREITLAPNEDRRFELTVPSSGEYVIEVRGASDGFDAYVSIFDETGEQLGFDDDGGDGLDSRLTISLEDDRTYYVAVLEAFDGAGRCSLSVQASTG